MQAVMRTTTINKTVQLKHPLKTGKISTIIVVKARRMKVMKITWTVMVTSPAERVVINIIIVIIGLDLGLHAPGAVMRTGLIAAGEVRQAGTKIITAVVVAIITVVGKIRGAVAQAETGEAHRIILKVVSGMRETAGDIAVVETNITAVADHPLLNLLLLIVGVVGDLHLRRPKDIEREAAVEMIAVIIGEAEDQPIPMSIRTSKGGRQLRLLLSE